MKTIAVLLSVVAAAAALEPCMCTLEYNPVCGSDGRTYGNLCSLKCYQRTDSALTLAYHGECQPDESDLCICTFIYSPVCGSDGRTYGNECSLKCEQRKDATLTLAYHGECKPVVERRSENVCRCTKEYNPVCGTDAVTYDNLCLLKCARESDASIFLLYEGACKKDQKPVEICTLEYFPICGSDGRTYGNQCEFDFTRRTKKDLYIVKYGEC